MVRIITTANTGIISWVAKAIEATPSGADCIENKPIIILRASIDRYQTLLNLLSLDKS